ncbi:MULTISPECIES: pyridoxamine 5'-phosphate oxidase family protein [Micromonospora]|uniref:Pyridoxamine 5'-phosphate oxidase family protein n=1 Tax=Micromonospora solifontis TaxID=2487138 RepID=A0ABX9WHA1_9ACTN|nr:MULTISPECIES: pyridoxamine 5'-phosphate oxidase family protein [Micromonospora]NES15238.1 pyridoxamine 5'-phosphate oxidase family protein [Micromonospora sp. PPF5-17B]NES36510.1 pyridoxamine 5'-phosphate oxidase family protein [Micromonospora solifontis]NES56346.1 pyridoxamine 5'-phosphate oxidase family protein [Micromonospora sp. PPF5-6]RNL99400.1 pyridoxamine 5'-phosphate oxidase family protein [Micromonospora solifontis]
MVAPLTGGAGTDRTRVRRLPDLAVHDRQSLHAVLDAGRVGHLAIVDQDQPYALPVAYARDGERVLVHGSTGSRLFRHLAAGAPACLTVTLLDGLVLARSAFESSMNYRCAMVLGRLVTLDGAEKLTALERLSEHLLPGRWAQIRPPSAKELAATLVLALPLDECSLKISAGPPDDPEDDLDLPVWAGVVPVVEAYGTPQPDPRLRHQLPAPEW